MGQLVVMGYCGGFLMLQRILKWQRAKDAAIRKLNEAKKAEVKKGIVTKPKEPVKKKKDDESDDSLTTPVRSRVSIID